MKKFTPKQKKIFDIVITSIEVIIVLIAITLSAIVIANPITSSAQISKGSTKLLPVLTGSMDGTKEFYAENPAFAKKGKFNTGDLIIAKNVKDKYALEVGDIVTYVGNVNGYEALITHRIVNIQKDASGKVMTYDVQGDNRKTNPNFEMLSPTDVLAVYDYSLDGVGGAINWLQKPSHFLLIVVLPLIVLFIYNIIAFVLMLVKAKAEKTLEGAGAGAGIDAEEIKKKAIEEYLAQQKQEVNQDIKEDKNIKEDKDIKKD